MQKTFLIIVTGPPGSGKTTLAKRLAEELKIPLMYRDKIKEVLYETIGTDNVDSEKKLGRASHEILRDVCESLFKGGVTFIVESNFKPALANEWFLELKSLYGYSYIQIHCKADFDILYERFKHRSESGERHPGHDESNITYEYFKNTLSKSNHDVLDIGGEIFSIDTNDFKTMDVDALMSSALFLDSFLKVQRFM